jgi:hypothetical protein
MRVGMAEWPVQYRRMMRWHDRIVATVDAGKPVDDYHVDDIYAFFLMSNHLGDWLWNDESPGVSQQDVKALVAGERSLRVCADIANRVKHLRREPRRVLIHPAALVTLAGPPEEGGVFPADAAVVYTGEVEDALPLVRECVAAWDRFLTERGLLPLAEDR